MIKISVDSKVSFPRDLVYSTYRDNIIDLGLSLPNVRSLKLKSRQETEEEVQLMLEWHGGGDIPAVAKALLSEELFIWTEYDVWNNNEFTVDWRIETHAYQEAVFCAGKNVFLAQDNCTLGKFVHWVEDLLSKKIEPNLVQMGVCVQKYLEATQKTQ